VVFTEKPDAPQQEQTTVEKNSAPNKDAQEGDLEAHNGDLEAHNEGNEPQEQDGEVLEPPPSHEFAKVRNLHSLHHLHVMELVKT
jgi:hypothetical protein